MTNHIGEQASFPWRPALLVLLGLLSAAALYALSRTNYLLYHSLIELFAVGVAVSVFTIGWNTRHIVTSNTLFLLAVAYGCIAGLDLLHTLAYSGMGVFPDRGSDLPTQLWIATRFLEALSLLAAALLLGSERRLSPGGTLAGYCLLTGLLITAILLGFFPAMYIQGLGLTPGKIAGEYIICALLAAAAVLFWRRREEFPGKSFHFLLAAIGATLASELSFTLYTDVYGFFNFLGHLLKLVSFLFIYLALVSDLLLRPYEGLFRDLTLSRDDLKKKEWQLREAEEKLRAILDTAPSGIILVNTEGRITFANERMAEMLGYEVAELTGSAYLDHTCGAQRPEAQQRLQSLLNAEIDHVDTERLYQRKDGTLFWGNLVGKHMLDSDGAPSALVGIITDITARKEAEERLQAAHDRLNTLVQLNVDGLMVLDREGMIRFLNPAAAEMLGLEQEELLGEQFGYPLTPGVSSEIELLSGSGVGNVAELRARETEWDGQSVLLASFRDITERKQAEERIYNLAYFDELTALPNRSLFHQRLEQAAAYCENTDNAGAVLQVDISRLREVNDSLGQQAADELIREVGRRIADAAFEKDTVARISGGEFMVLSEGRENADRARKLGSRILEKVGQKVELSKRLVYPEVNIGFTLFPQRGTDPETLIKQANMAMTEAKKNVSGFREFVWQEDWRSQQFHLEHDLKQALANEEFHLYYQTQVDLRSGHVVGMEALIRWKHPQKGLVPPGEFIPVLERTGMIVSVDEWVIHRVCKQLKSWQEEGIRIKTSANLSAQEFNNDAIIGVVRAALDENNLDAGNMEVEITETSLMKNVDRASMILETFSGWGVRVALDDFGKGYSSLSYLQKLPITTLKIDKQFVSGIPENRDAVTLAQTIIAMAHNMGKEVLAEGVEREEQWQELCEMGCDYGQGFLWSYPQPVENLKLS